MTMLDSQSAILISCPPGLSVCLAEEVQALGFPVLSSHDSGVETRGIWQDTMRMNLHLRTALHVHFLLRRLKCRSPNELYTVTASLPWERWISPDEYLTVTSSVDTPSVNNSMFASLKVKDAVVDRIHHHCGRRPNSGPDRTGVVVSLFWKNDRAWIYLNTSGQKLSDRGYRKLPHAAPLNESLAAGMLLLAGYDGSQPLVLPMCGSGTLAIEAALIALRRAPGLTRSNFSFMHVLGFDEDTWSEMRRRAKAQAIKRAPAQIIASDLDPVAVDAARQNARTAGVEQHLELHVCDFEMTPMPSKPGISEVPGVLLVNPEYGERLGNEAELEMTYKRLGDFLKQRCIGWRAFVLTGSRHLAKFIGLRASRRIPLFNAGIECRLLQYDLYAGSRETSSNEPG